MLVSCNYVHFPDSGVTPVTIFSRSNVISGSESCSGSNRGEHKGGNGLAECSSEGSVLSRDQSRLRSDSWALNVEDIDFSVVDELPLEIQREVRSWVRPSKRPNTTKRGSTIAHYFGPAKS